MSNTKTLPRSRFGAPLLPRSRINRITNVTSSNMLAEVLVFPKLVRRSKNTDHRRVEILEPHLGLLSLLTGGGRPRGGGGRLTADRANDDSEAVGR